LKSDALLARLVIPSLLLRATLQPVTATVLKVSAFEKGDDASSGAALLGGWHDGTKDLAARGRASNP
jgi:hypothetical protein